MVTRLVDTNRLTRWVCRHKARRNLFIGRAAFLVLMVPLLSAWSWWRDDDLHPTEEECLEMAIESSKTTVRDDITVMVPEGPYRRRVLSEPKRPSDYADRCEPLLLRGCLLPPERVGQVEEYQYRLRHCAKMKGCGSFAEQTSELQAQKQVLRGRIVQECFENEKDQPIIIRSRECAYALRQIEPVIDALAMLEISFQTECF